MTVRYRAGDLSVNKSSFENCVLPCGAFGGYVDGDDLVVDLLHSTRLGGGDRKIEEPIRLRDVHGIERIERDDQGRFCDLSSSSTQAIRTVLWERLEYKLWRLFRDRGEGREEISEGIIGMMRLGGVSESLRNRIVRGFAGVSEMGIEELIGLLDDCAEAAISMDAWSICFLGRDEYIADFVSLIVVEALFPEIVRRETVYEEGEMVWSDGSFELGCYVLKDHGSLGQYHSFNGNVAEFLTDLRDQGQAFAERLVVRDRALEKLMSTLAD